MARTLFKLFVVRFYKANTGFFLFFFFIFFGTVNGGSLISYHASLLRSIMDSPVILCGVFFFWTLYEVKCLLFLFRIINSDEGSFLYNLQSQRAGLQLWVYSGVQVLLYAPVLVYSVIAIAFGCKGGHITPALAMAAFQVMITICSCWLLYRRMNNWLKPVHQFRIGIHLPKPFFSYLIYHLATQRKMVVAGLKIFSVLLLYIVLVLNSGKGDNDSFLLFYLLVLLAHFIIPFLAVQFFEKEFSFSRNLPLRRIDYALAYLLCYVIILLPELAYLLLYGRSLLSVSHILAYYGVALAGLFLLTAVQYSEAMDRDEYMKVGFALFFVSIFALHIQAFLIWTCIQFFIAIVLFWNGFYSRCPPEGET